MEILEKEKQYIRLQRDIELLENQIQNLQYALNNKKEECKILEQEIKNMY